MICMETRKSWEDIRNGFIFEPSNYRAYRVGIGDALNLVVDSICSDLSMVEGVKDANVDFILGKYNVAKMLLDQLVEANRQHEETLSKMLTTEIRDRIFVLEEEKAASMRIEENVKTVFGSNPEEE